MSLDSYLSKLRARNVAVNIVCNDGCQRRRPIDEVFFCQECGRLTCDQCAATEIDTFYCPNCLTSVLTSAAFTDQNRCQKCVDCPQCFQTLTIVQLGADFAFSCEFCQWSSKSIGLIGPKAQQLTATLKAQEDAAIAPARFNDLCSLYKDLYKDAKKDPQSELQSTGPLHKPHSEHDMLESVAAIEKSLQQKAQQFYRIPAEFYINDAAKPPPQSLLDEKFDPLQVTSLEQRFSNPSTQPTSVAALLPRRKHLVTKNAYRCRQCTKYVVKPKVGAAHVAFDKRSVALSVLPIITISEIPQGTFKSKTLHKLVMYFTNPIRSDVSVTITEGKVLPPEISEGQLIVADTPRLAEVTLPSGTFVMNAFDELLEQDDDDGLNRPHKDDDPEKIVLRDRNRIGLRFSVIPLAQDVDIKFAVTVSLHCKVKMEFEKFQYTAEISLGPTDDSASKQQ